VQDALPEDLASAWERVREELRTSLPASTFDLWLEPLRPVSARGATLYLTAPAPIRTWVERRYLPRLGTLLRAHAPQLRDVRLLAVTAPGPDEGFRDAQPESGDSARPLPPAHAFDRFVIGPGNRLAHAASLAVAEMPGEAYNPLFLHGAPGLGKTHLLGAIAMYLRRNRPDLVVRYTTAERFTAEFVTALRTKGAERFKERYRELNVLLIDDVQFLEDKPHTEEEFFHTFNALYEAGGQLVLSCDRPPEALSKLAERLRDRFEWGLRVQLSAPDLRTRITLLQHLARREPDAAPPAEALREIALRVPTNFRRLEGALIRVVARASISGQEPTPGLVRDVFECHPRPDAPLAPPGESVRRDPTVSDVQEAVCAVLHLSLDELLSARRTPRIARARQLAMYLCREVTGLSLAAIARDFKRDHSTVLHAIRRVETSLEPGSETHDALDKSRALLGGIAGADRASSTTTTDLHLPSPPSTTV
jgi:chromosomal replication initiator protein